MPDHAYPDPHRLTLADLDLDSLTTDQLVSLVQGHRNGEPYPTSEQLLANLPTVLRALCDYFLSGQASPLDAAYRLASVIDAVEGAQALPISVLNPQRVQ